MLIPTLILSMVMTIMPITPAQVLIPEPRVLAVREFSLENRYPVPSVNDVFRDNILLTVSYATGVPIKPTEINWDTINKPSEYKLSLNPGETFAFHDDVLPEYEGKIAKTTNAHYSGSEGFKSDGYLMGDGVCHLASLLYWVAKDAGLTTVAPVRHDFALVPDVPQEYGVSIFSNAFEKSRGNQLQNLYITNNKDKTVTFVFNYNGKNLVIKATE